MSEKQIEETKPKVLDWSLVDKKFDEISNHLSQFVGKKGYNPFLYNKHKVKPLKDEYNKLKEEGKLTKELYDKIISLKLEDPTLKSFPDQNLFTSLTVGFQPGMVHKGPTDIKSS